MLWQDCNTNIKIETGEESGGYYTFGEKGFENLKAKGYKKIIYKNLYPSIDVEYTIPKKGGIKYKLILRSGADVSKVKMKYSGDVEKIKKDISENILIETPAGNIVDHAPISFYETNNKLNLPTEFKINNNTVSFKLNNSAKSDGNIIIDPWTTMPDSLPGNPWAYDVATDDYGEVYISGGSGQYCISKYTAGGAFIWNYSVPTSFWTASGHGYSEMCVLPPHGSILLGEPINLAGPRIMKVNCDGTLASISASLTGSTGTYNYEIWIMFYNRCTGQLMAFGGGPFMDVNLQQISDTNITSSTINNFDGYAGFDNDIGAAIMDYNGDFYAFVSSGINPASNHIFKSSIAATYNPPPAFDVPTTFHFEETTNNGIPGFVGGQTVRANILALNTSYLFGYDGDSLIAWDKGSGAMLGALVVDPGYNHGYQRNHEGIAVDDCNNVYVGGAGKVHVFNFDGATFTPHSTITATIPGQVYDLAIDQYNGILYACGDGFLSIVHVNACNNHQLTLTTTGNCLDTLTIAASGGTPPYSFLWSDGSTTNSISGPPGMYTVSVSDNSCKILNTIDTVEICPPPPPPAVLTIPNVFTPNGDSFNDVFEIYYDGNESYNLLIFNRWGKIMFSTTNKNEYWNGKAPGGKNASDGVYYYILTVGEKSYHGSVTLLR